MVHVAFGMEPVIYNHSALLTMINGRLLKSLKLEKRSSLSMVNGAIAGQLHLRKNINDKEYEVDQPMSLSCSPTTYTLEESYSIVDDPTEAGHLHRTIQADGRSIKIYDLSTHQETSKV